MSNNPLKKCPFCRSEAELRLSDGELQGKFWMVVCPNVDCLVNPDTGWRDTRDEPIEAWNRRSK